MESGTNPRAQRHGERREKWRQRVAAQRRHKTPAVTRFRLVSSVTNHGVACNAAARDGRATNIHTLGAIRLCRAGRHPVQVAAPCTMLRGKRGAETHAPAQILRLEGVRDHPILPITHQLRNWHCCDPTRPHVSASASPFQTCVPRACLPSSAPGDFARDVGTHYLTAWRTQFSCPRMWWCGWLARR